MGRAKRIGLIAAIGAAVCVFLVLRPGETPPLIDADRTTPPISSMSSAQSASRSDAELPVHSSSATRAPVRARDTTTDWYNRFKYADDYVSLVRDAAAAAEAGDDVAAWELWHLLFKCAPTFNAIRAGRTKDEYLIGRNEANPERFAYLSRTYDPCAPVATAQEFAEWDAKKLRVRYWRDMALSLGNPAAKAEQIVSLAFRLSEMDREERRKTVDQLRENARQILRSGNAEAWYLLGMRAGSSDFSRDLSFGFAVALASCDLGYDCSGSNERNDWYGCRWQGDCSAEMDLSERLKHLMPADLYAKSYARYQQLMEHRRREEWVEIEKYVPLDGRLFREG